MKQYKILFIFCLFVGLNTVFGQITPKIGDEYQGGIVAYLNGSGGGLIAMKTDLGVFRWSDAIKACKNSELNGFTDWYFPSKMELNLMYINKDIIGNFNSLTTPIFQPWYWSSSGNNFASAWAQDFNTGEQVIFNWRKSDGVLVRAVRAF